MRARSAFLSDLHLGSPNCHVRELADFLAQLSVRKLYLVGDVIDLWWMASNRVRLDHEQTSVIEHLRALARGGTEIIYIPGNHDRPLRELCGLVVPGMVIRRDAVHRAADGRRYLVTHGDDFDDLVAHGGWRERLGDRLYDHILAGNRLTNRLRRRLGMRYWSLADFIKRQSSLAQDYIERYVDACTSAAIARGLDGVICGHIHRPALLQHRGIIYANDGDWVESLTAITEADDGALSLVRWRGQCETLLELPAATQAPQQPRCAESIPGASAKARPQIEATEPATEEAD